MLQKVEYREMKSIARRKCRMATVRGADAPARPIHDSIKDRNSPGPVTVFAFVGLAVAALVAASVEPVRAQSVQEQLVGVYTLARFAGHGDEPTGRISYDAAGRMWAMVLPPGRSPYTNESTAEEVRDAVRGVITYYGTYTIDESTGRVIHHLEAASNPAWIGADFVRWYRFEGRNLVISLNPDFENTLLWERLPDE